MSPLPSLLDPTQFLLYVVGPIGGAAVIPTLEQIEASNAGIAQTMEPYPTFEEKRALVLAHVQNLFNDCAADATKGQESYIQAGSLLMWLMWNDPNPMIQDHRAEMRWLVFGVVGGELQVKFGDTDDDFAEARDALVTLYGTANNVQMAAAPVPTKH